MRKLWLLTCLLFGAVASTWAQFAFTSGYPNGGTWGGPSGGFSTSGNKRYGSAGGPSNSCQGPLNFSWTWSGSGPAPQYAILTVVASASWGGSPTGSCNDGFNDPVIPEPPPPLTQTSGSSSGEYYFLKTVSGGVVTYSLTPTASSPGGGSAVSVTVTITPIYIALLGPTTIGSTNDLAVGQYMTATVYGMGDEYDTYDWSTPSGGNPFAGYSPSQPSCAAPAAFSLPGESDDTLSCYFGAPASVTISCSYWSSVANITVPLSVTVNVVGPGIANAARQVQKTNLLTGSPSYDWSSGSPYPNAFRLWDSKWKVGNTTYISGMWEVDTIQDPAFLTAGSGEWGYVQIINFTAYWNGSPNTLKGLDGGFPATDANPADPNPTTWTNADGTTQRWKQDGPGYPPGTIGSGASLTVTLSGTFGLYIFYKPVSDGAGASVFVPVTAIPWTVSGGFQFTYPTTWGPVPPATNLDTGSALGTVTNYPPLSAWPTWP